MTSMSSQLEVDDAYTGRVTLPRTRVVYFCGEHSTVCDQHFHYWLCVL